jgi:integrase
MSMEMILRRMKVEDATMHGFRSSFRDWVGNETNFPREVAEAALAHVIENKAEAAYRRGDLFDKRRRLMADWARHCAQPAAAAGKVVELHRVEQ